MKRLMMLTLLFLCLIGAAQAAEYTVDPAGNGDFTTLTEAVAAVADGDVLTLRAGLYDNSAETFPILVEKSITIQAAEGETPVISSPRLVPAFEINADGIRVDGLQIDFLRSGMWIQADDVTVENCSFTLVDERWRTSSCGMWVAGSKRLTLTDNVFTACGVALAGPHISEHSAGLPVLTGMFEVGEDVEYFTTHTFTGNLVNGKPIAYVIDLDNADFSEDCGQLIVVNSDNSVFHDMNCDLASMGIQLFYCNGILVENCTANDCGIFGIYVAKSWDCILRTCRADRGAHGFDLRAIYDCVVDSCYSEGSGQGFFFSNAYDSLVVNCDIVQNGTGFFAAAGDRNHMDNCRVIGNELGIYIETEPNFTATSTLFQANTNTGSRTLQAPGFALISCVFEDNWVAALSFESEGVFYYGNTFSGSAICSMYLKDNIDVRLLNNTFTEDDEATIRIAECENLLQWPTN